MDAFWWWALRHGSSSVRSCPLPRRRSSVIHRAELLDAVTRLVPPTRRGSPTLPALLPLICRACHACCASSCRCALLVLDCEQHSASPLPQHARIDPGTKRSPPARVAGAVEFFAKWPIIAGEICTDSHAAPLCLPRLAGAPAAGVRRRAGQRRRPPEARPPAARLPPRHIHAIVGRAAAVQPGGCLCGALAIYKTYVLIIFCKSSLTSVFFRSVYL